VMADRVPQEMLHDVIVNTIYLDNAINEVIRMSFDIQPSWGHPVGVDENGEIDFELLNELKIEKFDRFFLQELGSSSKLRIIREIINDECKVQISLPKEFDNKFLTFYKIRNIFAHSLYPKHLNKHEVPNYVPSDAKWEELHAEHTALFKELNDFFVNQLFNALELSEELEYLKYLNEE
jgi:hypothetical protein